MPLFVVATSPVHPSFSHKHCRVQTSLQPAFDICIVLGSLLRTLGLFSAQFQSDTSHDWGRWICVDYASSAPAHSRTCGYLCPPVSSSMTEHVWGSGVLQGNPRTVPCQAWAPAGKQCVHWARNSWPWWHHWGLSYRVRATTEASYCGKI